MSKFSFIHAADLHLGSSLKISNREFLAEDKEIFASANYDAFARLVDSALEKKVDFLLLAGDIYDSDERSIKANRVFKEECQRLDEAGIEVYLIAGNHDPIENKKELFKLPDNVVEFSAKQAEDYEILDGNNQSLARIFGQSYQNKFESEKLHKHYQPQYTNNFNIALLHTELNPDEKKYVPATKVELEENPGIDYWALGHIHQCKIIKESNPVIAYSGSLQGRDFGERELKGALLVEVDNAYQPSYSFIPTSKAIFKNIEINLNQLEDEPENITELQKVIIDKAEELSEQLPEPPEDLATYDDYFKKYFSGYIVRWVIKGRVEIHDTIAQQPQEVANELRNLLNRREFFSNEVWTAEIKFRTRAQLPDLEELKEEREVAAEIAEVFSAVRDDSELKSILQDELGDIWGASLDHEDFDSRKFQLTEEAYQDILEETKNLITARITDEE